MTYSERLKDPRWQKKRLEIMQRDNFTCQNCLAKNKPLQVHHWSYSKNPWDTKDIHLVTLCENCHKEVKTRFENMMDDALSIIIDENIGDSLFNRIESVRAWIGFSKINEYPILFRPEMIAEAINTLKQAHSEALLNSGENHGKA
jgi:hypothetical protein